MSSAFENVVGGKLSLKGPSLKDLSKKKRKKKHKEKSEEKKETHSATVSQEVLSEDEAEKPRKIQKVDDDGLTEAERSFLEVQRKREEKEIKKLAKKSHKERVEEFNKHIASLSEHYEVPKVSWTK
eukprot:GCRY01000849.1.p1 GENE.GCRY01000849.1~~GCRY01000849.1.p1  ORF type:complete len:126 (+),score=25.66 GCRY01000849.1:133-510(+)